MFSSNNSVNPSPYDDQPPFSHDGNPNSRYEPPSFFHYSPPLIDQHDHGEDMIVHLQQELLLGHLLSPQLQLLTENTSSRIENNMSNNATTQNNTNSPTGNCGVSSNSLSNKKTYKETERLPLKKPGKKDRHSKINTAQGLRDRRMRLSLKIARKFFDLQDMLGFDKASKTVEWLLTKSKSAIRDLMKGLPHVKHNFSGETKFVSSSSECVVSGVDETAIDGKPRAIISNRKSLVRLPKEKEIRPSKRSAFHPLARESRAKARERARERTKEKRCTKGVEGSKPFFEATDHSMNQLWPYSRDKTGDESGYPGNKVKPSLEAAAEFEESSFNSLDNHIITEYLMIARKSSPASNFNHHNNIGISHEVSFDVLDFPDLPENFEVDITRMNSSYCYKTKKRPWRGSAQELLPTLLT